MRQIELVVIGASAGGISAIGQILRGCPDPLRFPVVIVLHLSPQSQLNLDLVFHQVTKAPLIEVIDKMPIRAGSIYFAPPSYHLQIESSRIFSLSLDEPVHFSRPSIDVLFESAAQSFGSRVGGILLTGANQDGAQGLLDIQQAGGWTCVQEPGSAEVSMMPASALRIMKPDEVLDLSHIGARLRELSDQGAA